MDEEKMKGTDLVAERLRLVKAPVFLLGAHRNTVSIKGAPFKPVLQSASRAHSALGVWPKYQHG
jgi:hypothetical protein